MVHCVYCILFIVYYNILSCKNSFISSNISNICYQVDLLCFNIEFKTFLNKMLFNVKKVSSSLFWFCKLWEELHIFMNAMKQNILWEIHALCSNWLLSPVLTPQSRLFGYIDLWIWVQILKLNYK